MNDSPKSIWRSVDDLAETNEIHEFTAKEFPGFANVYESLGEAELDETPEAVGLNRRQFVALSAAALGLAGLAGCRRPELKILPFAQTPDFIVPGVPLYYATSMPKPGGCFPILVESHEGRPTKIEGHPRHPASLGATDARTQASILDLYSPDRSKEVLRKGGDGRLTLKSWEEFDSFAADHFAELRKSQGEGLRFLIEDNPSPALRLIQEQMKEKYPQAVWHSYEPIDDANSVAGTILAFGQPLRPSYNFNQALRVVALDCDFLGNEENAVANGRSFAQMRRHPNQRRLFGGDPHHDDDHKHDLSAEMNRLYVLENTYTVTGTLADHRLRIPSACVADYAVALAKEIASAQGISISTDIKKALDNAPAPQAVIPESWIKEIAADLVAFKGKCLILAGNRQPAFVHALCAILNEFLGNPVEYRPVANEITHSMAELVANLNTTKTLVIVGGNPVFNAPADFDFASALANVPIVIRFGQFVDETSEASTWHAPLAHYLESWGDAETGDGTYSMVQPLIAPLHGARSALEFFIYISNWDGATSHIDARTKVFKLVQESFKKRTGAVEELEFKRFIHEGFVRGSARPPVMPAIVTGAVVKSIAGFAATPIPSESQYEISIHPDYALFDGRFAWNNWLLEFPDPITKLVWDNAALVSPKTAAALNVKQGDLLEIEVNGTHITVAAFILPGQADMSISLQLGYGKLRPSRVAAGGGFNVYPIRTSKEPYFTVGKLSNTGKTYELVTTQEHGTIPKDRGDDIVRVFDIGDFQKHHQAGHSHSGQNHDTEQAAENHDDPKTHFQWGYNSSSYREAGPDMRDIKRIALDTVDDVSFPQRLDGHMQWGMVIDLNTCTGCSACVIACQAENNIPVVGKGEVKRHREMHWISLHRYFSANHEIVNGGLESPPTENPRIITQPMMCQHCEAAPCESVCPVNASVHSPEGLNLQVYNRCIGTRYCANNCPYKARRFNWFDFNKRRVDELRVPTPFSEAGTPETLKMQKNPEVTVRMRGVMEKCTYCIQRIEKAKIGSKVLAIKAGADKTDSTPPSDPYKAGFDIRQYDGASRIIVPDGIITTACAQACPTQSIVFGNVRDEKSKVFKLKNAEGVPDYLALGNLNTKPRTSYLPRLRNPNPKMTAKEANA